MKKKKKHLESDLPDTIVGEKKKKKKHLLTTVLWSG